MFLLPIFRTVSMAVRNQLSLGSEFSLSFLLNYGSQQFVVLAFDLEFPFTKCAMMRVDGCGHASLPAGNLFIKNMFLLLRHFA